MSLDRGDLSARLARLLADRLGGRGVGAVAVRTPGSPKLVTAWVPGSCLEEPAFLTYSITKVFTAALALLLQEEGRLDLDDKLSRWFPDIRESAHITVRSLLNHTAGIPDYGALPEYRDAVRRSPGTPWTFEEFGHYTWQRGLAFAPGAGWTYSNPGYLLVKRILERVAGASYAELVRDRISRPLGLVRTCVPESIGAMRHLAPAWSNELSPSREARDVLATYHPGWVSHGVVASTPSETVVLLRALFMGQLVSATCVRELTTLVPVSDGPPRWRRPSYGLGLMADPECAVGPVYGHNGGGPGYDTSIFHAPCFRDGPTTVCAMCAVEEHNLAESIVFDVFALV